MQAIRYVKSIPRYLAVRSLSRRLPAICTSVTGCIQLADIAEPRPPNERWVRVRPLLSGICGSDLATIRAEGSAYFSPLTSTPFVLGHEVVGLLEAAVPAGGGTNGERLEAGARVVIEPALGCQVRGIDPVCGRCREGNYANCENVTRGDIAAGIQTGYCRDTGGGWSECLVAHLCQLHRVPDELSDAAAVLAEPFSCALHAALRSSAMASSQPLTILVIGCGTMGLLTIAALRAGGVESRIIAVCKHRHQTEHATRLGATEVILFAEDFYEKLSETLTAEVHPVEIGMPTVIGGAEVTFDCVGSSATIDDALRFTRAHGEVVLVGMPGIPKGVDWTTIWYKELRVRGAYTYGWENYGNQRRRTFDIALEILARQASLEELVTHRFGLADYRQAIQTALNTGATQSVKTVFAIGSAHGS